MFVVRALVQPRFIKDRSAVACTLDDRMTGALVHGCVYYTCLVWFPRVVRGPQISDVVERPYTIGGGGGTPPMEPPPSNFWG